MSDIYRDSIFWVEVERISPNPYQPRREFNEEKLNGLAESIRMYGLLQPLTVTRKETAKEDGSIFVEYELIAGERRLRASKVAGLSQVPVIIRSGEDTDQMKLELAIIENLQREDLNPVDRAKAFLKLHKDFEFTHLQIGKKVGRSREYVSNTLRLLSLPESILNYLAEGRISEGHTRPLLMLKDKPEEQAVLAREILLKKLTVRESEALARRSAQNKVTPKYKINPEILSLEKKLTEKLGTRVQIEQKEVGGKLVISFFSAEDLATLLDNMRLENERKDITRTFDGSPTAPKNDLMPNVEITNDNSTQNTSFTNVHENDSLEAFAGVNNKSFSNENESVFANQPDLNNQNDAVVNNSFATKSNSPETLVDTSSPSASLKTEQVISTADDMVERELSQKDTYVKPDESRPLPEFEKKPKFETQNKQSENIAKPQENAETQMNEYEKETAEEKGTVSKIMETFSPKQPAPAVVTEKSDSEEDPDLYSIKNFSI